MWGRSGGLDALGTSRWRNSVVNWTWTTQFSVARVGACCRNTKTTVTRHGLPSLATAAPWHSQLGRTRRGLVSPIACACRPCKDRASDNSRPAIKPAIQRKQIYISTGSGAVHYTSTCHTLAKSRVSQTRVINVLLDGAKPLSVVIQRLHRLRDNSVIDKTHRHLASDDSQQQY